MFGFGKKNKESLEDLLNRSIAQTDDCIELIRADRSKISMLEEQIEELILQRNLYNEILMINGINPDAYTKLTIPIHYLEVETNKDLMIQTEEGFGYIMANGEKYILVLR